MLAQVASILEQEGFGTPGVDIFIFFMPDDVEQGILLVDTIVGTRIDHELPGYRNGKFQLIVRHQDYEEGMKLALDASEALTILETEYDDVIIKYLRPRTDPVAFPPSEGDNLEFAAVFDSAYILK